MCSIKQIICLQQLRQCLWGFLCMFSQSICVCSVHCIKMQVCKAFLQLSCTFCLSLLLHVSYILLFVYDNVLIWLTDACYSKCINKRIGTVPQEHNFTAFRLQPPTLTIHIPRTPHPHNFEVITLCFVDPMTTLFILMRIAKIARWWPSIVIAVMTGVQLTISQWQLHFLFCI